MIVRGTPCLCRNVNTERHTTNLIVRTLEVADLEDRSTRLRCGTLKLRTVDLDKALAIEVLAEQVTDTMLELEHGLVRLCLIG